MNRETKFRAWSKKYKRFLNDCEYPIGSDASIFVGMDGKPVILNLGDYQDFSHDTHSWARLDYDNDLEIIWSTGLKDKNGKEIYEGDIVSGVLYKDYSEHVGRILYDYNEYRILTKDKSMPLCLTDKLTVIGNIYENPELLEE